MMKLEETNEEEEKLLERRINKCVKIKAQNFLRSHRCRDRCVSPPPGRRGRRSLAPPPHLWAWASVSHSNSYSSSKGSSSSNTRSGSHRPETDPERSTRDTSGSGPVHHPSLRRRPGPEVSPENQRQPAALMVS